MDIPKKLEVGDFITVVNWKTINDNSYKGDCLEVKVIDGHLLRVQRRSHYHNLHALDSITLDTNQVNIRILSQEFVNNVLTEDTKTDFKAYVAKLEDKLDKSITLEEGHRPQYYWIQLHYIAHSNDEYTYLEDKWRKKALSCPHYKMSY